jgi:hypothetical protein
MAIAHGAARDADPLPCRHPVSRGPLSATSAGLVTCVGVGVCCAAPRYRWNVRAFGQNKVYRLDGVYRVRHPERHA